MCTRKEIIKRAVIYEQKSGLNSVSRVEYVGLLDLQYYSNIAFKPVLTTLYLRIIAVGEEIFFWFWIERDACL